MSVWRSCVSASSRKKTGRDSSRNHRKANLHWLRRCWNSVSTVECVLDHHGLRRCWPIRKLLLRTGHLKANGQRRSGGKCWGWVGCLRWAAVTLSTWRWGYYWGVVLLPVEMMLWIILNGIMKKEEDYLQFLQEKLKPSDRTFLVLLGDPTGQWS